MPSPEPHQAARPHGAPSLQALADSVPPPLPLYHHPVIALSLVFTVACLGQIAASRVNTPPPANGEPALISRAVHGHLFAVIEQRLTEVCSEERTQSALFSVALGASLLSAAAWYAVTRLVAGPAWGLWMALLWVVHPSFALLAQRQNPMTLLILLAPVCLALLLRWARSGRSLPAVLAGASLGLIALNGLQGFLALPVLLPALLAAPMRLRARAGGTLLVCAGFALALAAGATIARPPFRPASVMTRLYEDAPLILGSGDSLVAATARRELASRPAGSPPSPVQFLLRQFRQSPAEGFTWLAGRLWRAMYRTADGRLQRPLFAIQVLFLAPALWGIFVALRFAPWRWPAVTCCLLAGVFWLTAGLIEPLARNLVPIGGVPVLFALVGAADIYERLGGRRLTPRND